MGEAAVALGRAAGYTNAGTAEFLLDQDGRFYFLEVNARLQVEHPVTEMATGQDLVRLQFTVAAGEPLPIRQSDVRVEGHAIECRLYAEDPAAGFLPSTGRIERFRIDDEVDRVDAGVTRGDVVTPFYDPLLAKILVHAEDRHHALVEMGRALEAAEVSGVRTNLELLRAVIASPAFERGDVHTGFIDEHDLVREATSLPDDVLIAAAASETYIGPESRARFGRDRGAGVWQQVGPWRVGWVGVEICYSHLGGRSTVRFTPTVDPSEPWRFEFDGRVVERRIHFGQGTEEVRVGLDGHTGMRWYLILRSDRRRQVLIGRRTVSLEVCSPLGSGTHRAAAGDIATHDLIRSTMPGRVVRLLVGPGDHVKTSQTLVILEAMKIEHLIAAPRDGIVEAVRCREGDQVDLGAELIELED